MVGKRIENEFALDLFNCVANKTRSYLIRQVVEGAGDSMSGHIFYLTKATPRSRWLDKNYCPLLRQRCADMVNKTLTRVFLGRFWNRE